VDAMLFIQLSTREIKDTESGIDFEHRSKKSGYNSEDAAIYAKSYELVLPEILGQVKGASTSRKALPAVPSFEHWDPQMGGEGVSNFISESCNTHMYTMDAAFGNVFSQTGSEAEAVAKSMLVQANAFVQALVTFVTQYYIELTKSSDAGSEECWTHVSHIVRCVFRNISRERKGVSRFSDVGTPTVKAARFLWGALQAHRVMAEYTLHGFKDHPSLGPILTRHLFVSRPPASKLVALETRLAGVDATAKLAKVMADKALTAANKRKTTP
jgi:hypothetical protein